MRTKIYNDRVATSISLERDILERFQELCKNENKTLSEKIGKYIIEELRKNK